MPDHIHIVFATDKNYLVHAGVTIESILFRARDPRNFHFYFLQPAEDFPIVSRQNLQIIIQRYGAGLDWVTIDSERLKGALSLEHSHVTQIAYGRFLIPEMLPQLDRCLYLDCDLVALDDLAVLWAVPLGEHGVAVVRDNYVTENLPRIFPEIGTYFNSGVVYMNLRRWREKSYGELCLRMCRDPQYVVRYEDQDVLNVVFAHDALLLDARWNITSYDWPNFWTRPMKNPGIAHYAGGQKPWNHPYAHYYDSAYWFYLARTPWAAEYRDAINQAMTSCRWPGYFVRRCKKSAKDILRRTLHLKFP